MILRFTIHVYQKQTGICFVLYYISELSYSSFPLWLVT